ncbi:hypothetical protein PCCS19_34440 [Paenibacillus sp. CCS19]|uniref:Ger(x)C family spore germination protein n=1 Tax=Paenibacillus sp. CCS19 TaxID=3158387 RepID=UPI00255E299E|nr:Ger(x)C family spore germination protein [Paenibacillus cellulosilyticus]GMK40388.1 hypothetical protein PCCS19_34440 [Paenibacillus cellulosilyticus]
MRALYLIMFTILCAALVSGCWNRRELNELAVSVAVGVDKKNDGIRLSDQVLNVEAISGQKGSSGAYAPVNLFQETGQSFQEAARKMTRKSSRKIYVGQLQMLVFGEDFARGGVAKVLDHISRDHEYRSDFLVIVARETEARDVLKVFTPLDKTPATKLKHSLEVSSIAWGVTTAVQFREFTSNVISKGKEAVLTGVNIVGSRKIGNTSKNVARIFPSAGLVYAGLAVFKKDKLMGWLNEEESFGYNFTQGNIKSAVLLQPCSEEDSDHRAISVELLRTKTKMKALLEDGNPIVSISVKGDGVVTDAQCALDFTSPSTVDRVERGVEEQIKSHIASTVRIVQMRYNSDIFGFGELFERKYPGYWKKSIGDWDAVFPTIQVRIQPNISVKQMYKTTKSIEERMKG